MNKRYVAKSVAADFEGTDTPGSIPSFKIMP
jgi:hypothetical protein